MVVPLSRNGCSERRECGCEQLTASSRLPCRVAGRETWALKLGSSRGRVTGLGLGLEKRFLSMR